MAAGTTPAAAAAGPGAGKSAGGFRCLACGTWAYFEGVRDEVDWTGFDGWSQLVVGGWWGGHFEL